MRKIIIGLAALFILIIGVVLFVPGLIPSDVYKEKIETQLSKELGRKVSITGDVKLQTFPLLRAKTSGVTIENYDGFSDKNFLSVEALEARVRLIPLFSKRVEISGFELIKPEISIERRADGQANWEAVNETASDTTKEATGFKRNGGFETLDPQIEAFTLVDGRISYKDNVAGQSYIISDIDGFLSMPGITKPFKLDLALDYDGTRAKIDFSIESIRAFLDGQETPLKTVLESDFAKITIDGKFLASEALDFQGQFSSNISDVNALSKLSPSKIDYIELINSLSASGDANYIDGTFGVKKLDVALQGDGLVANYEGDANLNNTGIKAMGRFDTTLRSVADIAKKAKLEMEYAVLLQTVIAGGNISIDGTTFSVSNLSATAENGAVNGSYSGQLSFKDSPDADGKFTLQIPNLAKVTALLPEPIPYSDAIETLETAGQVTTKGDYFVLSAMTASIAGLLNGTYEGGGQYSLSDREALSLDGKLAANVNNLRALAALNSTELMPNTATGKIFETLAFNGTVSGTTRALTFKNASLNFDDITGKGQATVSLTGAKPLIEANLTLAGLDLRPYMASFSAQNPSGEIQPWSTTPINVDAFKAIDGTFVISTPSITTDRLSLGQTDVTAKLNNGILIADLPNLSLYGGGGRVDVTFDASNATPELTLTAGLNKLNGNKFLNAIAGFTQASGQAKTELSIKGVGRSQAELMKSLNGQGGFNLNSGSIKGIDTAQFLTGLDQALTSRQLPSGIGADYSTAFKDIAALFQIENGVVTINEFNLVSDQVSATGLGKIDLGNQTIDFRFRPKAEGQNANKLASFGIPLKFSGGFGSASAGLDSEFLTEIITARAKAEASARIKDNVKGPIGDILGGVIGSGQTGATNGQSNDTTSPEGAVTNALGGLLGIKTPKPEKADDKNPEETSKEDKEKKAEKSDIEKALGSLFGE